MRSTDAAKVGHELWESWKNVDVRHTKPVKFGRGYTSINAHYQLEQATIRWGSYGNEWGLRQLEWSLIRDGDGRPLCLCLDCEFYYPSGSFPISVDMPFKPEDECRKKLMTQARSKALSYLGFGASIYMGEWDDERFVSDLRASQEDKRVLLSNIKSAIATCRGEKSADSIRAKIADRHASGVLSDNDVAELMSLLDGRIMTKSPIVNILYQKVGCQNEHEVEAVRSFIGGADDEEFLERLRKAADEYGWDGILDRCL